jgi:hypothetical protein
LPPCKPPLSSLSCSDPVSSIKILARGTTTMFRSPVDACGTILCSRHCFCFFFLFCENGHHYQAKNLTVKRQGQHY